MQSIRSIPKKSNPVHNDNNNDDNPIVSSSSTTTTTTATTTTNSRQQLKRTRPISVRSLSLSSSPPTSIEIRGVPIYFPFTPYECQIRYMTTVITALQQNENALLESPTGTGKTLCLLCATLAYQKQQQQQQRNSNSSNSNNKLTQQEHLSDTTTNKVSDTDSVTTTATTIGTTTTSTSTATVLPDAVAGTTTKSSSSSTTTIIYASRTHSQLSQVIRELRNTRYRPKHTVLGSREQLCIHPKVNPNSNSSNSNSTSNTKSNKGMNDNIDNIATATTSSSSNNNNAYDINQKCNKLGKERKCRYRNNLDGFIAPTNNDPSIQSNIGGSSRSKQQQQSVRDMEEIIIMGKQLSICPFYYTRSFIQDSNVDIIFIPYNYLFDKDARETTLSQISWNNAIIIFDEAHNLESFASDSASFDLSHTHIAGCIIEVTKTIQYIQNIGMSSSSGGGNTNNSNMVPLKLDNVIKLKSILLRLENYIMNLGPQTAYNGEFMMDIFYKGCGINYNNHEIFIDEVRKVNDFLIDIRSGGSSNNNNTTSNTTTTTTTTTSGAPKLEHLIHCIKRVFGHGMESKCFAKAAFYRVHVSPKTTIIQPSTSTSFGGRNNNNNNSGNNHTPTTGRTVSYWCFAPSLAMEELASLNVRSILVTSGTLSPLPSYSMELGLPFPHTLENPHIISPHQIHVRVIGKGVSGKLLNSSYERRQDNEYYIELGNTLIALSKIVPEGLLLFFPSYSVMESCIEAWGGPVTSKRNYYNNNNNNPGGQQQDFFAKKKKQSNTSTSFSFPYVPTHFATDSNYQQSSQWKRLLSTKSIVVEPKSSSDLQEALSDFKRFLGMPKSPGCILMGVCRGKISEGIDFADEQSRAVVITGLPFPPSHDTKVKMKREYLDKVRMQHSKKASVNGGFEVNRIKAPVNEKLSGNEWYVQQAHRAVNQAIGRVIRNRNDYGAVLLLDSRFDQPQNQQGLSKWLRPHIQKDEGCGTAIRSLVDFYKTASSFTEAKKAEEKRLVDAVNPVLQYEDDEEDEIPSKIALVRRSDSVENQTNASDREPLAYVDPNDVVARLDVNDVMKPKAPTTIQKETLMEAQTKSFDAVFDTKLPPLPSKNTIEDKSKSLAIKFMKKITENISNTDQSTIRKSLVAMKSAGEKNDQSLFIEAAQTVVKLITNAERFDDSRHSFDSSMLSLFFSLLPKPQRSNVECVSFELIFQYSTLFKLLHSSLDEQQLRSLQITMGHLLQKLWCGQAGRSLSSDTYLREARSVLKHVGTMDTLNAYLKLIPSCYHIMTQTWTNEMIVSRNIAKMKERDRTNVGEATVDAKRFQNSDVYMGNSIPRQVNNPSGVASSIRKVDEPFVASRRSGTTNPYAKSKVKKHTSHQASVNTDAIVANTSVKSILESVESSVYIKPSKASIVQNIKTNAPDDLQCAICSEPCREPFIADCGHVACLSCWLGWLIRSQTCMTCRVPTKKESLARLIYERKDKRTPGNPTLSQLCQDDDSDDELEICS